jgi:hypothetical protein
VNAVNGSLLSNFKNIFGLAVILQESWLLSKVGSESIEYLSRNWSKKI